MRCKKAIIIGGGIAGPATALFLQRIGMDVEIYEAHREAEPTTGWFLNLAGNGIEVLKELGIAEAILTTGSSVPRMIMWTSSGKRLGEVHNGAREGLTKSVIVRRSALQSSMHSAVKARNIPLHFGKKLTNIESLDEGGVTAHFDDGTRVKGDVLVGADGIHSRVRKIINPEAPAPRYTRLVSTGGFTSRLSLPPTPHTQHFIFGKRAFFGYHIRSSGEVYWFNNHARTQEPGRSELTEIKSDGWKKALLEMHSGDIPIISEIVGATEGGIGAFPIYDLPPQPIWHRGSIVLIGDALHAVSPSSGQGASLAIEDAVMLAKCLRVLHSQEQALTVYEQVRRERVERMVTWARGLGGAKMITNPIQVFFRDLIMPFFLKRAANPSALDWIYDYKVDWDKPIADVVHKHMRLS